MQQEKICRTLLCENDSLLEATYSLFLEYFGYQNFTIKPNEINKINLIKKINPDLILIDANALNEDVSSALEIIKLNFKSLPIILISNKYDLNKLNEKIISNIDFIIPKPIEKDFFKHFLEFSFQSNLLNKKKEISASFYDLIDIGISLIDYNGQIYFLNKLLKKQLKLEHKYLYENLNISYNFFKKEIIDEILQKGFCSKYFFINQNNDNKIFKINFIQLNEPSNYIIAIFHEETEKFNYLTDFIKSANFLSLILDNSLNSYLLFNEHRNLIFFNKTAYSFFKKNFNITLVNDLKLNEIFKNFYKNEELEKLFFQTLNNINHQINETIYFNNEKFHLNFTWLPLILNENLKYVLIKIINNTYLLSLEERFISLIEELNTIYNTSIQRFYLTDLNYRLISFNRAAKDIIYKEFGRILKKGDNVLELISTDERREFFKKNFELAKKGEKISYVEEYLLRGEKRYNEIHLDPIINEKGEINLILIWTLDITEKQLYLQKIEEANKRYELIVKGSNDGIFDWDFVNKNYYFSPRWKNLLGYEEDELPNSLEIRDALIHPNDKERVSALLNDFFNNVIQEYETEFRLRHKNGNYIWVIERGEIYRDKDGKVLRFAGAITDITHLKQTEENLRKINKTLQEERELFIMGNVIIMRVEAVTHKFKYISENVKNVLGYNPEEFISGKITYDKLIHPNDYTFHLQEREKAIKNNIKRIEYTPYRMRRIDGTYVWVKDFSTIIYDQEQKSEFFLSYLIDITELKEKEEQLKLSNLRYQSLFTESSDAIFLLDEYTIIDLNKSSLRLLNIEDKDEVLNSSILKILSTANNNIKSIFNEMMYNALLDIPQKKHLKLIINNKQIDVEVTMSLIVLNNKKLCFQLIAHDISDRIKIEKILKENEERIKNLIDALPDLLFIIDNNYNYLYFKPDREKKLANENTNVIGKNLKDFFSDETYQIFKEKIDNCLNEKKMEILVYEMKTPIGIRKFEARLVPISENQVLKIVRDIT